MSTSFYDSLQESTLAKTMPQSIFFHALLIFGIGFGIHNTTKIKDATLLDITIVNMHSDKAPEEAELIAQVNQDASGDTNIKNRPTSMMASKSLNAPNELSPLASEKSSPNTPPVLNIAVLTTKGETFKRAPKVEEQPQEQDPTQKAEENADKAAEEKQLASEVAEREANYAKMPRKLYLTSVSARNAIEAEYIDSWAKKIERIGTTNFPVEAIRYKKSGQLIVEVTLDHHGSVVSSRVKKSSKSRILDNGALRIIKIAGDPSYLPLPKTVREKFDQLVITRTFIFDAGTPSNGNVHKLTTQ
ncbi:MAG: Protein TonB [uncultured Thiotrichaceae bacterium]|uniref:Protein TonB n=1 Tax=uncultured Thiotrichaceae bacterium TaxID=298394 RepID=A0A6S6U577_9GAMM|nr:MAG: Protein TonB [uncultured Thiotrichaceae bacterium]